MKERFDMKNSDGRRIAADNETRVLRAVHRFGWLRTRDIAILVWRNCARHPKGELSLAQVEPTASELRMAQRTLRRLVIQRMALRATAPDGAQIYALAESGARRLQDVGLPASSGKDLVRSFSASYYRHRTIANAIAVAGIVQGYKVSTEREISRGLWAGGENGLAGKKPDVLLRAGSTWCWVEVERSRRNATDYAALLKWLGWVRSFALSRRGELMPGAVLGKVVFICTEAFEQRLRADLARQGWNAQDANHLIEYKTRLYTFQNISFGN